MQRKCREGEDERGNEEERYHLFCLSLSYSLLHKQANPHPFFLSQSNHVHSIQVLFIDQYLASLFLESVKLGEREKDQILGNSSVIESVLPRGQRRGFE